MPYARSWTEEADTTIKTMRAQGATWSAIGCCLGLSRNTVIERGRRLCAAAPKRNSNQIVTRSSLDDPNRDPLPAGHKLTWGLLSDDEFPRSDDREVAREAVVPAAQRRAA